MKVMVSVFDDKGNRISHHEAELNEAVQATIYAGRFMEKNGEHKLAPEQLAQTLFMSAVIGLVEGVRRNADSLARLHRRLLWGD